MRPSYSSVVCLTLIFLGSSGCSLRRSYPISSHEGKSGVEFSSVRVLGTDGSEEFISLARVHVHSRAPKWLPWLLDSPEELLADLKQESAKVGGDYLLNVRRYSRSQFEWREEHLMGTAAVGHREDEVHEQ